MHLLLRLALLGSGLVMVGCSGPGEGAGSSTAADTSDIAAMVREDDGTFFVRCMNGRVIDHVPVADIQSGKVCLAAIQGFALGWRDTYVVTAAGAAFAWGSDWEGQLGIGSPAKSPSSAHPAAVTGLGAGVVSVAAGSLFACALTTAGGVKCWGKNNEGQTGSGAMTQRQSTPLGVVGLGSGVKAIAAGGDHACALTIAGTVVCWGGNFGGELGNGTQTASSVPIVVPGLPSPVKAIAAGGMHTCALLETGSVMCWGENLAGQLGDGTTTGHSVPAPVVGLSGEVTSMALGGAHSCALLGTGGVECWGDNHIHQLGDGTSVDQSPAPRPVSGLASGVAQLAAGGEHNCVVTTGGTAKCWGQGLQGQLGTGKADNAPVPTDVLTPGIGVRAVALGQYHSCLLTTADTIRCFGNNDEDGLGVDSAIQYSSTPIEVWH